jgi:hypothetical protein
VLVQLEFDPPTEARAGRFGDQYMYFLAENRIMWLDPEPHTEILRTGAHAGDQVAICKRELKNAGRKHIRWEVVLQQEEPAQPAQPHHELHSPAAAEAFTRAPAPPPRSAPRTSRPVADLVAGNLMTAALAQAIEALEANQEKGYTFDASDARALAITIYIAATGGKSK